MTAGAARLLADEALRSRFAEAGRLRAVERFAERAIVAHYRSVYEGVLATA
jgi:glycosyltransferase involved in cell wall biosynthesis